MMRFLMLSLGLVFVFGCGGGEVAQPEAANETPTAVEAGTPAVDENEQAAASISAPTDIVGQFLDALRRGDAAAPIEDLLTQQARQACQEKDLRIQPLGTADATFEVTRGQMVPGEENACLVHCLWNEPDGIGQTASYQLVWALRKEAEGWRISGVIAQMGEEEEPLIIDFEDPEALATHFGPRPAASVAETPQAEPEAR